MPWAQTDAMSERLRFVTELRRRKSSFRSLCAAFGVSAKTGYKWLHQFETAGQAGLQDHSRRPKSNSRAISAAVAERLVELRREHPTWDPRSSSPGSRQTRTEWTSRRRARQGSCSSGAGW